MSSEMEFWLRRFAYTAGYESSTWILRRWEILEGGFSHLLNKVGSSLQSFEENLSNLFLVELLKIKTYRAPRDKVICVLNCCKVIFGELLCSRKTVPALFSHEVLGLLRHSKSDQSADSFVPLLIYVVLQANPDHLVSNVQYILRFRNSEKLGGEAGYYLSSLVWAEIIPHLFRIY
jgi:Vacuolar sorting protein 9 (VPS9) domain